MTLPTPPTGNYNQFTNIATWILSTIVAIALAKGWITPTTANALNNQIAEVGAAIIVLVTTGALIIGNQMHRLRYGPTPLLPSNTPTAPATPTTSGPASPSYSPPSTGSGTAPIAQSTDLPAGVV